MDSFLGYQWALCQAMIGPDRSIYTYSRDGTNLDGLLDYESIRANTSNHAIEVSEERSIWR
ncbi:MAG: hypothetical protein WBB69_03740 [Anaerolineales bacterium]